MNVYEGFLNRISEDCADASVENPEDFKKDGLLYCGKCGTQKQVKVTFRGIERIEFCDCACLQEEYEIMRKKIKEMTCESQRESIRDNCFPEFDVKLHKSRFDIDDGTGDKRITQSMKKYAFSFSERYHKNQGILLYGNSGVGKSFLAACVANHVIDNGYTALFTNVSRVKNQIFNVKDKQKFMDGFAEYDLLIIDDFGLEARTDYTNEIATQLIDIRCNSEKPMIITSNLRPDGLKQCADMDRERLLSRILGCCIPVLYVGEDRRRNHFRNGK